MLLHHQQQLSSTFERRTDGEVLIQCSICFFSGFSKVFLPSIPLSGALKLAIYSAVPINLLEVAWKSL